MSVEAILERSGTLPHLLQLYEADDTALVAKLAGYLGEGLRRGQAAIAIVSESRRAALTSELQRYGCSTAREIAGGRLILLDADRTLGRLMVDGYPDADRFDEIVGALVRQASASEGENRPRVYGELVGTLWRAEQFAAAIRIEQLWDQLQRENSFSLFCSYRIDVFGKEFDGHVVNALLCAHTHLLPTAIDDHLERALARAIQELLGLGPDELRNCIQDAGGAAWGVVPSAEAAILWLRREYPRYADTILESAKTYFAASTPRRGLEAI